MTDLDRGAIADRFIQVRNEHKMNQREMAKKLGVSASLISEIERRYREPSRKILIEFKRVFGYDIEWLLTGNEDITMKEKDRKISDLEAVIKVKEQEIAVLNQEKIALQSLLITTQTELLKAKDDLLRK
jgi:transcriptional regulator with XRE-family HTH domain